MAASVAFSAALPLEEICAAAIWARPTTFIRHYQIDVESAGRARFGQAVLLKGKRPCHNPR
jgi:hypothetical protein